MQLEGILRHFNESSTLVLVLTISLFFAGCERQQAPQAFTPQVSVVTVEPREIVLTTELPGRTTAYRTAEIRPQVNGLILKRLFTEGADVSTGDVLYQIDPAPFQAAYDNAAAALGRSKANLPSIKARVERYEDLLPSKAVSQQEYDDAEAALRQNEADIKSWEAALKTARINLQYTRITAPISGRIGRSSVTEGAIVTAYQPVALSTIQQMDTLYVDVQQSTTELLHLRKRLESGRLNQNNGRQSKVKLIMSDGSSYPHEGTLQFRDVSVDPTTGSVTLRVVFPNPDGELLPGMFVRAVIQEGVNQTDLLVPQRAVSRNAKGEPYVYLVNEESKVELRSLNVDRAIGDQWLVSSGLQSGDRVVIQGIQMIRPGSPVNVVPLSAGEGQDGSASGQSNGGGM
jgi:membrane fusion protein (multidrug efflux system)